MARIPGGEFLMGSDEGDEDERPVHPVWLDDYYIGVYPVTNAEYHRFISETGYRPVTVHDVPSLVAPDFLDTFNELAARFAWNNGRPPEGLEEHPVTLVQHRDAVEYCAWLTASTNRVFRLPTEAEWEKAARGGLDGKRYPWGDDIDPGRANYLPDSCLKARRGTQPVGSYPCNAYRLFDMADWYGPRYYATSEHRNPQGPPAGRLRCVRGGSWVNDDISFLRCAHRHEVPSDTYAYSIGFRVAYSPV
jgi:sulfatase modifying factor 1